MVNFRISERDAEEQIDEFIQYVMPEITPAD